MEGVSMLAFGEAVARFRARVGLSQQRLAEQLGKHRRTIAAWEGGEYLPKTRGDVLELVRILTLNDEETILLLKAAGMDPAPPFWNVPHQRNPYFTGREELFNQIDLRLAPMERSPSPEIRRVALTQPHAIKGLGGIGKTQIAIEYAYRSREQGHYTHTFWINAANEETILTSFVTIAGQLKQNHSLVLSLEADQRKVVEAVKLWLERCNERWLLIFDNADDVALVRGYLPQSGNGSILLTTRAHAVGSIATSVAIDTMGFVEGTHLLLRRAQRFEQASDEEINRAGNIVIELDHFPLALDQAGAYIEETGCSFEEYLDLYQAHRQALLARRGMPATNYPYSVATTWLLSFQKVQQVNPAAAELLKLCSFLAPDRIPEELLQDGATHWPAPLQQAVANPVLFQQLIEELLKFSLVKRLVEEHTLSIHRLVQAVQIDTMEQELQRQWAERIVRAVNDVFPKDLRDTAVWPQCQRYLDQAQACDALIGRHALLFVEAADLLDRASIYLDIHALYTLAEPLALRALAIREQELSASHPDTALSLNNVATIYKHQEKYGEAESLYQRALAIREQELGASHPETAISLNDLAALYSAQGKYKQAEALYERALMIDTQVYGTEHVEVATDLNNLASLYYEQGRYEEAEPLLRHALQIREKQLGDTHPDTASSLDNLASLYADQGRDREAEPLYQRALAIYEQQLGASHPSTILSLNNLGLVYQTLSKQKEAESLYQRALASSEQHLGATSLSTGLSLNNLAGLYLAQGKHREAEPLYQRALAIYAQQLGATHPSTATSLNNLAEVYRAQGKYSEAEPLYQQALAIYEQHLGTTHPFIATILNNLGLVYRVQRKYSEAEPLYQRALAIDEQHFGREHPRTQAVRENYAFLLRSMGRDAETEQNGSE
jgi:tetratricopeptide (TPR) repeat protein/transcriptional regulator with XRE-family HTH domain